MEYYMQFDSHNGLKTPDFNNLMTALILCGATAWRWGFCYLIAYNCRCLPRHHELVISPSQQRCTSPIAAALIRS